MEARRLTIEQLAEYIAGCTAEVGDLVIALRQVVLRAAPAVDEAIKFHALCYFKPGRPFGAIGGNVCMISPRADGARLEFIHGASLLDPAGLLRGTAKAKRYVEVRCVRDIRRGPFQALIRAALTLNPCSTSR